MISTNKDIEIKFRALELEIDSLKRKSFKTEQAPTSSSNTNNVREIHTKEVIKEVDSQLMADSNTILHKLFHIFNRVQVEDLTVVDIIVDTLLAELITVRNSTSIPQIHLTNAVGDVGTYIMNDGNNTHITSGCAYNGTNWIAKNTTALRIAIVTTGYKLFFNSGLTVGNSFTPTLIFDIGTTGIATFTGQINGTTLILTTPLAIAQGGTAATTAANARTGLDVYSKAEVDSAIAAAVAGKANTGTYTLTIASTGDHNHGGASAGAHSNSGTVTI